MAPRRFPTGGLVLAVAVAALAGCKDDAPKAAPSKSPDERCAQLAKTCGSADKHVAKILDGCKQAAAGHEASGCGAAVAALYDCFEKKVCGGKDAVWALEDLDVLAQRHGACEAERKAVAQCGGGK